MVQDSRNDVHAEQVFFNLHYRASMLYLRHTSKTVRMFLEFFWMLLAVSGFAGLICLHLTFVYRGNPTPLTLRNISHHPLRSIPSICLPSIPGFRADANVTHLVLVDGVEESFVWEIGSDNEAEELCSIANRTSCPTKPSLPFDAEVHFSYSSTKGYALLTPNVSDRWSASHGIPTQIVAISKTDARCFGEPFLQETVFKLLGPDLVMMNWLLAISNGTGYVYNPRSDKTIDLSQYAILNVRNSGHQFSLGTVFDMEEWTRWFRPWTSKFRTAVKTCLIYFISTNLVSFLLRVAQDRLLELSIQIRNHQQENRSIIPLFVTHVADCFVFIPITVGVLFYLREFYQGNWVIALTVMAVVFICELFSFFSVRTAHGIFFFPRAFFLLFCLVHFYLFSFPFGFSYVAMEMIVCFMLQCVTFFWNRYEVPAVALGRAVVDHRTRIDYVNNFREFEAASRETLQHQQLGSPARAPSQNGSTVRRNMEPVLRMTLQPQYQQHRSQISRSISQGAFSQGRMSRASSEAIFQRSLDTETDDESGSWLYFLGGEVVIRRGDHDRGHNASGDSAIDSNQMTRYDSTSTIQSAVAQLGTIADDEVATSSLQAIHDLTPRLCNVSRSTGTINGVSSGGPLFPVLDSTPSTRDRYHHHQD